MTSVSDIFRTMSYGPAPESTARAEQWLDGHERRFGHFIEGGWVEPSDGEWFDSINPAKDAVIAAVAQGSEADVDRAVAAARGAQADWAALGGHGRARHMYAVARGIQRNSRLFAVLESLDNGKPIRESRDIDIPAGGPALLPPRRLGAVDGRANCPASSHGRCGRARSSRGISPC